MSSLQPTMLWENTDAGLALRQRFGFASAEEAATWLVATLSRTYGIHISAVDRLVVSAYNLLAWLTSGEGPLLAKSCARVSAHPQLQKLAELVHWLAEQGLPVSAPLRTQQGEFQVLCDQRSLGVQRVAAGVWLDPEQCEQTRDAGLMLARLHQTLAIYPHASTFALDSALPPLAWIIRDSLATKRAAFTEPSLLAGIDALCARSAQLMAATPKVQLVHQDYRAANLLWAAGEIVAVLDFEELAVGYRVNDLAWAAVHLGTRFHNWGPISAEAQTNFLESYRSEQPLTDVEEGWLPILLAWHSINLAYSAVGGPSYAACVDLFYRLHEGR